MDDNDNELRRTVGRRLRLARRLLELTQQEVADDAGVPAAWSCSSSRERTASTSTGCAG
jgi:transcriptional regulator with XRE-family HTH domain